MFTYHSDGRLIRDDDPAAAFKELSCTDESSTDYHVMSPPSSTGRGSIVWNDCPRGAEAPRPRPAIAA